MLHHSPSAFRNRLKAGLVLLPLLGVAWVFGVLAVNDDVLAFHYLFAVFTCFYGIFILLAYVLLSKNVRLPGFAVT